LTWVIFCHQEKNEKGRWGILPWEAPMRQMPMGSRISIVAKGIENGFEDPRRKWGDYAKYTHF